MLDRTVALLLILSFGLYFYSCQNPESQEAKEQKIVFPEENWQVSTSEEQGMDNEKMQAALDYLESKCYENGNQEVLLIKNGYIIYDGGQTDSIHNIYSCSKTFTSTVLGKMIEEGKLSLEEKVAKHEPLLEEQYADISFRHFTSMTSGYSAVGDTRWPDTDYADWSLTVYEPDTPYFAPGTAYAYWDEAQMMFGRVLTQVLQRPMEDYLKEKVTDAIGMKWHWGTEKSLGNIPINNGCTSVMIDAKSFARWGWLFANKGNWNGTQLLSSDWIEKATSVQVPASLPMGETDRNNVIGPGCYGFNWWINGKLANGTRKLPGAPEDCYFASGFNNNKCFVLPSWKMVIIRMGEDGNIEEADAVYGRFLKMLEEAMKS